MKISKKRLANKVRKLEVQNYDMRQKIKKMDELLTYLDELTTELNHALPDPEYDAKCEAQEADIDASLDRHRERLGLNKPQLKQLDQSVFNGLDEKWRFAAIDEDGHVGVFDCEPAINCDEWYEGHGQQKGFLDNNYDTSNWQNSLIERDVAKDLTGSELCKAMLERGDKYVMCLVFDDTRNLDVTYVIRGYHDGYFHTKRNSWENAIPINNQGEPLTAAEAGL